MQAGPSQSKDIYVIVFVGYTTKLVAPDAAVSENIVILFEGEPVEELWLNAFTLINDGDNPVRREDFDRPITLSVSLGLILDSKLTDFSPKGLGTPETIASFQTELPTQTFEISPLLLNPGDNMSFALIATNSAEDMEIEGRIAGVKELSLVSQLQDAVDGRSQSAAFNALLAGSLVITVLISALGAVTLLRGVARWLDRRLD